MMTFQYAKRVLAAIGACTLSAAAAAHVTLEHREATAGSYMKVVLGVPHGCDGAATVAIHVDVPEGVLAVKPMPKPGWSLSTHKGAYARSYSYHGRQVSEGVKRISWAGGNLPDDQFDEFVFQVYIADTFEPGQAVHLPVQQDCAIGQHRWNEIAPSPEAAHKLAKPAPAIFIKDKAGEHQH